MRRYAPSVIAFVVAIAAIVTAWPTPQAPAAPAPTHRAEEVASTKKRLAGAIALLALANDQHRVTALADARQSATGLRIAQAARMLYNRPLGGFRDDCSGYASAALSLAGVDADGTVATLYDRALANDALRWSDPRPGDLVFFDDTHDRDDDGGGGDALTHVGIVVDVDPDGVARFLQAGTRRGRSTGVIDVERPSMHRDAEGNEVNSYLRSPGSWDADDTAYLAGELWAGFGRVDPTQDWLGSP